MLINLFKKNLAKTILFFSISPGRKHKRKEIKEKLAMNNLPLDESLLQLLNLKIIKKEKNLYFLDVENLVVEQILNEIKDKFAGLSLKVQTILIESVSEISKLRGIKNIILFGSYAKLIFTEHSDIDLAVILEKNKKTEKKILAISEKISEKYKKNVHINFFDDRELKNKKDSMIKDIRQNGRELI